MDIRLLQLCREEHIERGDSDPEADVIYRVRKNSRNLVQKRILQS